MRRAIAIVAVVLGSSAGCHTITEDMPVRPTEVTGSSTVVIIPKPTVTPAPDDNAPPRTDPAPNPGNGGGGEPPTTNRSPVVKLNAHVYFIECNGAPIPGSNEARTAPVGCRVHFDCTARDGSNNPTIPNGTPRWTYSNTGILTGGNSGFNPVVTATGRGCTDFYAAVDGVQSGTSSICFE